MTAAIEAMKLSSLLFAILFAWMSGALAGKPGLTKTPIPIPEGLMWVDDTGYPKVPIPKGGFQSEIVIAYNKEVQDFFGSGLDDYINNAFKTMKGLFAHESLGPPIHLKLAATGLWDAPVISLNEAKAAIRSGNFPRNKNHYVLMGLSNSYQAYGVAYANYSCLTLDEFKSSTVLVSRLFPNLTGVVMAHEYAHTMKIGHDDGKCTQYGVMATYNQAKSWSNCSAFYYDNFYNEDGGRWGGFCLNPARCRCNTIGSVNGDCYDSGNWCKCQPGYMGPYCELCEPWTLKKITQNDQNQPQVECGCFMVNAVRNGWDIERPRPASSRRECHQRCIDEPDCEFFVLEEGICKMRGSKIYQKTNVPGVVSGHKKSKCEDTDGVDNRAESCYEQGYDYRKMRNVKNGRHNLQPNVDACDRSCKNHVSCSTFSYGIASHQCWLKGNLFSNKKVMGAVSGSRDCPIDQNDDFSY